MNENYRSWQQQVLTEQGLSDWRVKNSGPGDGLTMRESKLLICADGDYALFLHEVAHALIPANDASDVTGHGSIWGDKFTELCRKYLVSEMKSLGNQLEKAGSRPQTRIEK